MPFPHELVGRSYGPFVYEVGFEKVKEFAFAIGGGVPSSSFSAADAPAGLDPLYWDRAHADANGGVVAPPTFCVTFNLRGFAACVTDPALGLDLLMLVHGEQRFEFLEPVRPGDVMTTTSLLASAQEKAGKTFVGVRSESRNQHGKLAVVGHYTAVIRSA